MPSLALVGQAQFGDLLDIERMEWANEDRLLVQPLRRFPGFTIDKLSTGEIIGIDALATPCS